MCARNWTTLVGSWASLQTPRRQCPVLTKLNHNVGDLRAEAQVLARQRIESNRTLAQQNALTNQLTASVNGLRQEIGGLTGMMGTFLLVLTQQGSIGETPLETQAILRSVRKMAGITDGVFDDERARISTLEDRRDPYPHYKTLLDKSRSRERSPNYDRFSRPRTPRRPASRPPRRDRSGDRQRTPPPSTSWSSTHQPGQQRKPLWDSRASVDRAIKLVREKNRKPHKDWIRLASECWLKWSPGKLSSSSFIHLCQCAIAFCKGLPVWCATVFFKGPPVC